MYSTPRRVQKFPTIFCTNNVSSSLLHLLLDKCKLPKPLEQGRECVAERAYQATTANKLITSGLQRRSS